MAIETTKQTVKITGIRDITVTDTVDDGEGGYLRSIKVTADTSEAGDPAQVFELLIGSDVEGDLDITTPALTF